MFRLALQRIQWSSLSKKPISYSCNVFSSNSNTPSNINNIYEPEYLDHLSPEIPLYDQVNVYLKGYDYPVLESYQKYVHKVAASLDIDSGEGWALPPQKLEITRTEPNSSIVDATYHLNIYKRNLQVVDIPSTVMPIFIEAIQAGLPEGVDLEVQVHTELHDEERHVPDLELKELEIKLEELGGPRDVNPIKRK
uniref:39S ribosomal protein L48, mitochondrial n=1 Tax=Cacopsylla melanoneura TaxID=428564 RepID=A0A8D8VAK8_9HEMI